MPRKDERRGAEPRPVAAAPVSVAGGLRVRGDSSGTAELMLICEGCGAPLTEMEGTWLAFVVPPRHETAAVRWVHRGCAPVAMGNARFALQRADFALKCLIQQLRWKPAPAIPGMP